MFLRRSGARPRRPLEDGLRLVWALRRKPLESFLLPAAALDGGVLSCLDGSLVSLFRVDGARAVTGAAELDAFADLAERRLNSAFAAPGHALHAVFERAPDEGAAVVGEAGAAMRRRCARLGLAFDDVAEERGRRLAPLLAAETCLLACWTRPVALPPDRAKRDGKRIRERRKHWLPELREAQCPFASPESLAPRHEALVGTVGDVLSEAGLVAERLDAAGAVRALRRSVAGVGTTTADWRPVACGDDAPPRVTEPFELGAYPPPLAPQVLIRDAQRVGSAVRVGHRLYGALDMLLGPRRVRPFSELMSRLAGAGLPFRFSLLLEGGGLEGFEARSARIAANFLAFSSDDSRLARNAMRRVAELGADARAIVRLRLGLLTWVGADEGEEALSRRLSRLQQLAEGWGETVFTPVVGDPVESVAASAPGFCCGGTATPALAPIGDALRMLPVGRPAPLGRPGAACLFRSPDGKPLPFGYEDGEDYAFETIYGVPGRGKSVLLNGLALAFALQAGQARLPLQATIDIGPSSSGLISLIREALPPARRHEAGWYALRMVPECAINPCDTQLGCRAPLPAERAFLGNLLGLMLTPAGAEGVPDGMREAIAPALAGAYAMRSDAVAGGEPRAYTRGRDAAVDSALDTGGCRLPPKPLWWDAVDTLFDAGAFEAAARAQRYAVPVLGDLLAAVREPSVQALIGRAVYGPGGETVTEAFVRVLTSLSAAWPVLFAPTAFDVAGARVAAIDLSEVAPTGSAEADRQTAAFYLLARHALTRDWWIGEDALPSIPERYRGWHAERLRRLRETPKRLAYDEFHRTAGAAAVRAQVERDVREARKLRVRLALASQRIEDFGPALVELANRYWVLGAGGKTSEVEALGALFELSDTLKDAVRFALPGPGRDGAPALLIAADARGRFEQLVVNTPGPVELWALTTAPADVALRSRLYRRLPAADARSALARAFPEGTARPRIDADRRRLEESGAAAAAEEDILDRIADELAAAGAGGDPAAA